MNQGGRIDIHVDIKSNDSAPDIFNARVLSDVRGASPVNKIFRHIQISWMTLSKLLIMFGSARGCFPYRGWKNENNSLVGSFIN